MIKVDIIFLFISSIPLSLAEKSLSCTSYEPMESMLNNWFDITETLSMPCSSLLGVREVSRECLSPDLPQP